MKDMEKKYIEENILKHIKAFDILNIVISIIAVIISNYQIIKFIQFKEGVFYKYVILNIGVCISIIIEIIYWIKNKVKETLIQYEIELLRENNKNLNEANDLIRCFKHDFNNIMQTIDACIDIEDYDTLKHYFNSLMKESNHMNLLDRLNSKAKENPAIYSMLISKYRLAEKKNINMNIEVLIDLKRFNKKSYKISRMLGILLDNALEACEECDVKTINVQLYKEKSNKVSIVIENTYKNKDIDTNRIFEKNYTTKKEKGNSGLGLWKVNDIISNDMSLDLYTTKDDTHFVQQIEYYDESDVNFILK